MGRFETSVHSSLLGRCGQDPDQARDRANISGRERELATSFIPRVLRLFKLVDPDKSEESLVGCVRDKLRAEYQEKLSMYTIYTLEELNDLCLKVEAGRAAAKGSTPRRRNEGKQDEEKEETQAATVKRTLTTNNRPASLARKIVKNATVADVGTILQRTAIAKRMLMGQRYRHLARRHQTEPTTKRGTVLSTL